MNKDELVSCSLLVIDDLGEEDSVRMQQTLEVVDIVTRLRCDELLRTVITTNMANMAALVSRYHDTERAHRLAERMTKHGAWVDCPVEGLRRQGAIEIRPNTCLGGPPQALQQVAAHGGQQVVVLQLVLFGEGFDQRQGGRCPQRPAHSHRTIERHDGRGHAGMVRLA